MTDSTMTEIPCSNDPERIWLSPACCADPQEGRLWCQHKVWPEDDCDTEPTEYIRADKAAAMLKAAVEALDARGGALETCAKTFRRYGELHRAKGTTEGNLKASNNDDLAEFCEGVLADTNNTLASLKQPPQC